MAYCYSTNKEKASMKVSSVVLLLIGLYFFTRIISITELPVFADEAIYIRWAQMIFDDPKQFTFLPLYDGKTPLYIWMLIPLVNNSAFDPLLMARLLSVFQGSLLLGGLWLIVKELGGSRLVQVISSLMVIFLPFTFFHTRMALIDTLLTGFLAFSFWAFLKARNNSYSRQWLAISGIFWGLALMTKTSAFYYLPVIVGIYGYEFLTTKRVRKIGIVISLLGALGIGLLMIGWMRVSPLFPFLFQRSSDFAHPLQVIVTDFPHIISANFQRISTWLISYLTPVFWLGLLLGYKTLWGKKTAVLAAGTLLFLLPFLLTGKLLSSRYFLPVVIWLIPLAAFSLEGWYQKSRLTFYGLAAGILSVSLWFMWPLYTNPGATPFAHEDVVQYLTEWSAGYGIPEARDYLADRATNVPVYVATEGYFGTLPDGLSIYFHRSPLQQNLEIHGIGQPVEGIPNSLREEAVNKEVYLVVNEHRLQIDPIDPTMELIEAYPRPRQGPSLLLYRINP
jgi:4-amino-4-deoxy-L-arabinose transferase-like glycosyltransferase